MHACALGESVFDGSCSSMPRPREAEVLGTREIKNHQEREHNSSKERRKKRRAKHCAHASTHREERL